MLVGRNIQMGRPCIGGIKKNQLEFIKKKKKTWGETSFINILLLSISAAYSF